MKISGVPFVQGRNDYGPMTPAGIAIHNTANDATAEEEASYATRRPDGVGSHFYVDRDSIVQSIDTDRRTGHAGSREGNHYSIAFEITGVNGWTRQQWLDRVAWDKLARVVAALCQKYDIAPRRASVTEMKANPRVRALYGHDDMRRAWGGTTHTDPGNNFPWDHLINRVKAVMGGQGEDTVTPSEFVKILQDPAVAKLMRALPWQYVGGGIPEGYNTLGVANETLLTARAALAAVKGVDTKTILDRIEQHATAERERDQAAAAELATIRERLADLQSGGATAEEIVDELSARLGTSAG